jgi:hypothetical protein
MKIDIIKADLCIPGTALLDIYFMIALKYLTDMYIFVYLGGGGGGGGLLYQ